MKMVEFIQKFPPPNYAACLMIELSRGYAVDKQDLMSQLNYCTGMVAMMAHYGDLTVDQATEVNFDLVTTQWPLKDELPKRRPHLEIVR